MSNQKNRANRIMKKISLYRQDFVLPTGNEIETFEFQSLGFLFEVQIKNIDLVIDDKYKLVSIRIKCNKSITSSLDVRIDQLLGYPLKTEFWLMKRLFSNSQSLILIESIDD